jgi:NOL1/NOP2/fmu family ribosome biogenesis protein
LAEEDDRHNLFSFLEARFGIPERLFDDYVLFERKKSWSIMKRSALLASAAQLKVSRVGLKAFQKVGAFVKPTTRMIQVFGHTATKARLEIDGEQLKCLADNEDLPMDLNLEKGYVILSLERDVILGLGFYGHGRVKSQIPRKELRRATLENLLLKIDN